MNTQINASLKNIGKNLTVAITTAMALLTLPQPLLAADKQLGAYVDIQPRDIETSFQRWLYFGMIKVGASGGTITVSSNNTNTLSSTGDVTHIDSGYSGRLGIKGEKDHIVSVVVDTNITLSSDNNLGADITATTNPQADTLTLTAANDEWNAFYIGGTLTVPANQPADRYKGYYNASVNYQ